MCIKTLHTYLSCICNPLYINFILYFRHVFGKICFGEGERGNYDASEIAGRKALDHFPLDNWAHHALAHNFEESGRALQVIWGF